MSSAEAGFSELRHERVDRLAPSMTWLAETLYPEWAQSFRIVREIVHVTSLFQTIQIVETRFHGRVLLLDGCVQVTEADEFAYHEMIAHVPLIQHGGARRVLIIGAGDGGVLRRVLQHRTVQQAVMVEIDGEVVRLAREYIPSIGGVAWNDNRAEVLIGDGIAYLAAAPAASFDVIIVDSTDPVGAAEALFTEEFYRDCARVLTPAGLVVNQCGVPFMQGDELKRTSMLQAGSFPHVSAFVVAVPTYVGGLMALGIASGQALTGLSPQEITARGEKAGIIGATDYWSPEIHAACFQLPPFINRLLPMHGAEPGSAAL